MSAVPTRAARATGARERRSRPGSRPSRPHGRARPVRAAGGPLGIASQLVTTEQVRPALAGASIAGLVPALLAHPRAGWLPEVARDADQVVLLVLDGFGWHALEEHRDVVPN